MKLFYADRKIQFKHFADKNATNGLFLADGLSLRVPARENYVLQLIAKPQGERRITSVLTEGADCVCINTQCTDKFGREYQREIPLHGSNVAPVFIIVRAKAENEGKTARLKITVKTDLGAETAQIELSFSGEYIKNGGFDEPWRLSRLLWLNSSRFLDDSPVQPYFEPRVSKSVISVLGRDIALSKSGLPQDAVSYFDEGVQLCPDAQAHLLSSPVKFEIKGCPLEFSGLRLSKKGASVLIESRAQNETLDARLSGVLRYEGSVQYSIRIKAKKDARFSDITLTAVTAPEASRLMHGLGLKGGGARDIRFKWNEKLQQDCVFIGGVNCGARFKFKAQDYVRPLVNVYYKNLPLRMPAETWDNGGRGGISVKCEDSRCRLEAYTGAYSLKKGEERSFDFELHFTPFHPIDYKTHYSVRHAHFNELKDGYRAVDEATRLGLTDLNLHHGTDLHPFINYPFVETRALRELVQYASYKGVRVNIYYTVREHSNHMAEVFAYKALGDEIILRKKGDGHSWWKGTPQWLTEYFGDTILPAWRVYYKRGKYKGDADISFIVRPDSRLDNYYIEGLDWLVKNTGISGIYIDDTALDRTTLERAKKVLSQNGGRIDMHMWNHEQPRAGDVSCMNLYTEILPFLDSMWIGEGYDYKRLSPEYLLTEVSGIPYGCMSQMLEGGGDPFIGMLFGMNNRYGWGTKTARHIYKLWDDFGIEESRMLGWWHGKNPVSTGLDCVKATVYLKNNRALVAMYNFDRRPHLVYTEIDNALLGFTPSRAVKPHIASIQARAAVKLSRGILLRGGSGVIFELS